MPANAATRTAQIAIAVTAKNADSRERFLRFIMVVSLSGFRAGGNRPLDGDHFRLPFVRPRRRPTQGFCAKCTFRAAGAAARAEARAAPRASPMRGELLVNRDLLGVDRNVAARSEVLDDAVHHLARAADSRGDIVLGQALGHYARALLLDRVLVDELGEPAVDVLQGQSSEQHTSAPHSPSDLVCRLLLENQIAIEQSLDVAARDHEQAAR